MVKWEYQLVEVSGVDTPNLPAKLNVEGQKGWEFVKIIDVSQNTGIALILMKRLC
jgi:hypothetical protein